MKIGDSRQPEAKTLGGHRFDLSNVAWSHDRNNLASTSMDRALGCKHG
jgi:hypothetical protein